MRTLSTTLALLSLTLLALALAGCASSADSSASSASISSISASISASSVAAPPANLAYTNDVRMTTAAAVEAGASESEVLRSVGRVAAKHGVSDWEAETVTYVAIGEGLRLGGAGADAAHAFAATLTGGNAEAARLLLEGYQSA